MEGEPFLHWSADILELPESDSGHRYVLVMTDLFSKWIETFPLKRQTAEDVARCVVQVICRYGVMKSLLTDQGRNFECALTKGVCQLFGVKKLRTTIYHPCCNGQVERVNRSLLELLTHYVGENQRDWDQWLSVVTSAYNSGCHSTTGFAPWELVYGKPMRTALEAEFDVENIKNQSHRQFLTKLKDQLKDTQQEALEQIQRQQSLRTETRPATFQPGDSVWCRNFTAGKGVLSKLKPKFEGPYIVVEARPPDYVVKKGRKRRLIHGCHLKKGVQLTADRDVAVEEDEADDDAGGNNLTTEAERRPGAVTAGRQLPEAAADELLTEEAAGGQLPGQLPEAAADELLTEEAAGGQLPGQLPEAAADELLTEEAAGGQLPEQLPGAASDELPTQVAAGGQLLGQLPGAAADGQLSEATADGRLSEATTGGRLTEATTGGRLTEATTGGRLTEATAGGRLTEAAAGRQLVADRGRPPEARLGPGRAAGAELVADLGRPAAAWSGPGSGRSTAVDAGRSAEADAGRAAEADAGRPVVERTEDNRATTQAEALESSGSRRAGDRAEGGPARSGRSGRPVRLPAKFRDYVM